MSVPKPRAAIALLMLLAAVLAGCGGTQREPATASQSLPAASPPAIGPSTVAMQGIAPLPSDKPVPAEVIRQRRAAAVGTISVAGSQVAQLEQSSAHVDNVEASCVLQSAAGQLSWAIYALPNLLPSDTPLVLSLRLLGEQPDVPCYLAFSNYSHGTWDWMALAAPQDDNAITVGPGAGAISPGGNLYAVVATYGGTGLVIGGLDLRLDCANPPPEGFAVQNGEGLGPVHLSWVDPAVSFDPDGAGPQQFVYNGVQVQRASDPAGPWADYMQFAPGTTSFDDLDTEQAPNHTYYYRLATLVTGTIMLTGIAHGGLADTALVQLKAQLAMSPNSGLAPQLISFNGSSSLHSGPLTSVQWDFTGDGIWDKETAPAVVTSKSFTANGRFWPRLKLTMDLGGGALRTDTVTGYFALNDRRGDWSEAGRNGAHGGRSPMRGPRADVTRGTYSAPDMFGGMAVGVDGTVYAPCADGNLYCLNPDCSFWKKVSLGSPVLGTPAIGRFGTVWLVIRNGLFARQLACVWQDDSVHTYPPVLVSGNPACTPDGLFVVVGSGNMVYEALPDSSGLPSWYSWAYTLPPGSEAGTPAINAAGEIYVPVDDGMYKLSRDGKFIWKNVGFSGNLHDPAVAPDGTLYICQTSWLHSFNPDGVEHWGENFPGEAIVGAPAVGGDGTVYVSTDKGHIYARTPGGWSPFGPYSDPSAVFVSPPAVDTEGNVFALTADGRLIALNPKLGLRWSRNLGTPAAASTLAMGNDGTLYAGGTKKLTGVR